MIGSGFLDVRAVVVKIPRDNWVKAVSRLMTAEMAVVYVGFVQILTGLYLGDIAIPYANELKVGLRAGYKSW